jgi:type 1 glutamine amidotransferase
MLKSMTGRALRFLVPVAIVMLTMVARSPTAPATGQAPRMLLVTATAGFYHDSIPTAREVMAQIASELGLDVTYVDTAEELRAVSPDALAGYAVIAFVSTTGELPLSPAQKDALLAAVRQGSGFLGTHSATDTLYEWADYGSLVGAYFKEHPWTQSARIVSEESSHPIMAGVDPEHTMLEEYYTFRSNPRPNVNVLLSLDAASVAATGDHPLAWWSSVGQGRVYYNALGHFPETWRDPWYRQQLRNALRWLAFPPRD